MVVAKKIKACKLLKCRIFLLFYLLIPTDSFSQNKVSGIVISDNIDTLSYSTISAYNENETKLVSYAISDASGKYSLEIGNGTYTFLVSHLGYKPFSIKKKILKDEIIDFKLIEDATSLDEIIVKAKSLDATTQNDTIRYNLKQLATGNEENLKDLINKLPGLEIDENGKIKAHGKKIDKLLIDGKEFFGDQHQLATENINSEMINGISLIENYNAFSDIYNQNKSEKTALNIEIGDNYRGNIKGNVSVGGGYEKRYELNSNLYSFRKNTNLFFIANSNNIGKQTFTFEDYISFQGGIQKLLGGNLNTSTFSSKDLPSYLFQNDNVESKNEQFSALNFSFNPSNNFRLNSYFIFDRISVNNKLFATKTYIANPQNIILKIDNTKDNILLVHNSFINATYKLNKSIFEYIFSFSPQKIDQTSIDKFNLRNFDTITENNIYSLNQALSYKLKIKNYYFTSTIYHHIRSKNEELNIVSNSNFLGLKFQNNNYFALQDINNLNNKLELSTSISKKIRKKSFIEINYNLSKNLESFKTQIYNNSLINNINLDILESLVGLRFYNNMKSFINYNLGSNLSLIKSNGLEKHSFLPFAGIKLNFKKSHSLNISYKRTLELPQATNILEESYIQNFNTLINNENIVSNAIAKYDNFNLNYYIHDLFSGTLLVLVGNLIFGKDITVTNTLNYIDYVINNYFLGDKDKSINAHLLIDKRLGKIPFTIRLKNIFFLIEKNNFINGSKNKFSSNSLSHNINISSNFRKSLYNFEIGYERKKNNIVNKDINIENRVLLNTPYFNLLVNYNKLNLTINNSIEFYTSSTTSQKFFNLSPTLNLKINNKSTFYIEGNNLLNMNKNFIIQNNMYENYFEEKTVSVLGGFIITGLKYKF